MFFKLKKYFFLFSVIFFISSIVACSNGPTEVGLTAPSDVTATVSTTTSNTIVIKWTAVTGISDYWLYYSSSNDLSTATLICIFRL